MSLRNFPDASTSITLDFRKGKKLDPRITFERASSATEIGEGTGVVDGQVFEFQENVPRLTDKGLLIEVARTNSITYSFDLGNTGTGGWYTNANKGGLNGSNTKNYFVTQSNTTDTLAPDGTYTATKLSPPGTIIDPTTTPGIAPGNKPIHLVSQTTAPAGVSSFYIKDPSNFADGLNKIAIMSGGKFNPAKGLATFDLVNNQVDTFNTASNARIEYVGNGWYRISCVTDEGGSWAFNAWNGLTSDLYIWGAQCEAEGSFPLYTATSYIPTSGSAATRAADVAIMNNIDWFNNSESTLAIENNSPRWNGNYAFFSVFETSNPTGNRVSFRGTNYLASSANTSIFAGGNPATPPPGKSNFNTPMKYAFTYDLTDAKVASSYGLGSPRPVTGSAPVVIDRARISQLETGVILTAYVSRIAYYPIRASDGFLEALTS